MYGWKIWFEIYTFFRFYTANILSLADFKVHIYLNFTQHILWDQFNFERNTTHYLRREEKGKSDSDIRLNGFLGDFIYSLL